MSDYSGQCKSDRRKARGARKREHGAKLFTAEEIRKMLKAAFLQLRAMIMLAINGALGNTDCASLTLSALDLEGGWLDFPRVKTGVDRRIPLWPETVEALKDAIKVRPKPKDPAHANLVFLTRLGQPWVRYEMREEKSDDGKVETTGAAADSVATETIKLLKALGIYRKRVTSFYCLRHNFETIAGASGDQVAVDRIMGHVDDSMAENYRELIEDARLRRVTDAVRLWLFPKPAKPKAGKKAKPKANSKPRRESDRKPAAADHALRIVG